MKKIPLTLTLLIIGIYMSYSQTKLPNLQPSSIRAPGNIKIDGKATEWDGQFKAYNHATEIFYTLSNDDDRLYLTVRATLPEIINKIMVGGVSFTIQRTGKKSDKGGVTITYPVFEKQNRPRFNAPRKISIENGVIKTESDPAPTTDSAMNALNKELGEKSKLIGITGIEKLDTLISVYNTDGIKTAGLFNNKGEYTYELAVDLHLLGLSASTGSTFAYHVTINGLNMLVSAGANIKIIGGDGSTASAAAAEAASGNIMAMRNQMASNLSTTDFWGEYVLAKK